MKLFIGIMLVLTMALSTTDKKAGSVYDFTVGSIDGTEVNLYEYEGKVLLIVNTASECGFTKQYDDLQLLYETYKDEGFYVLGFPANNFGGQEPGTNEEILEFCRVNFGVDFPLFSKVSVKGEDQHPLFSYLTSSGNPDFTGEINWNFEKFLVNRNGIVVRRFKSNVSPDDNKLTSAVKEIL